MIRKAPRAFHPTELDVSVGALGEGSSRAAVVFAAASAGVLGFVLSRSGNLLVRAAVTIGSAIAGYVAASKIMGRETTASSGLLEPSSSDIALSVYEQLKRDYPAHAIRWVTDPSLVQWSGPRAVPIDRIDASDRQDWTASKHPARIRAFAKKIERGELKPIILIEKPHKDLSDIADGHHRFLANEALHRDALAYVGVVTMDDGPWDDLHGHQRHADSLSGRR